MYLTKNDFIVACTKLYSTKLDYPSLRDDDPQMSALPVGGVSHSSKLSFPSSPLHRAEWYFLIGMLRLE